jgi:hypothetical protein
VSPRIAAKVRAWERAGLLGPQTIRRQIEELEKAIDRGEWSAAVSGDLDELRDLLARIEHA